jgi:hypothetical protein
MVRNDNDLFTPPEENAPVQKSDEVKGEEGKQDGDTPKPEEKQKVDYVPRTEYEAARKEIADLNSRLTTLSETLVNPDFLASRQQPQQQPQQQPSIGGQADEKVNFDEMSREEYANYITTKTINAVGGLVQKVMQRQEYAETKKALDDTVKKYPDYWDYQRDMLGIAKKFPGLGPEEVYLIASGKKNPPKPPAAPKPTSSERPGVSTSFQNKRMNTNEAAEEAWKSVMGNG